MPVFTYVTPGGDWGISGVKLSDLPPNVYSALQKLRDLEHPDPITGGELAEKQKIMARLRAYRSAHHIGCWAAVARASRGGVSEEQLRDMCIGSSLMPLSTWRKAAKALDKLERREASDG